jgi:hypothetical protein
MKKNIFTVLFACGVLFLSQSAVAQIRINQIGFGVSSWTRTYDGADERRLLLEGSQSSDFKPSAALPHVFIEVGLIGNLGVEGRVGVWDNTFSGTTTLGADKIVVEESIVQRVTPVSVGLNYTLSIPNNENFYFHVGAGAIKYYLQNEVSRTVTGSEGTVDPVIFAGNNNGFYGKAALEYRITEKLGVTVHGRYNSGKYTQNVKEEADADISTYDVSLKGFEVGIGVSYRLEDLFKRKEKPTEETEEQ